MAEAKRLDPPSECMLISREVVVHRLRGRPRDPASGRHAELVIYARPDLTAPKLARHLRAAAEALDPR